MGEDTYEREDTRSYCEIWGHRYQEVSCEKERWKYWELAEAGERIKNRPPSYILGVADPEETETVYKRRFVPHGYDLVTYECTRCGSRNTKKENEF